MESLYTKLHDKYTELKTRKNSEMEQFNRLQEEKFLNYVSAAEEYIEQLKIDNQGLQAKINDLTNQMISDRSSKDSQYSEYQNLLIEEKQKTKELSEEIERLHDQFSKRSQCSNNNDNNAQGQLKSPSRLQVNSRDLSKGRKKLKQSRDQTEEVGVIPNERSQEVHVVEREREWSPITGTPSNGALEQLQLPSSCGRYTESSGDGVSDIYHANCIFQTLVECLLGMKFSIVDHTKGLSLSILHQSSDIGCDRKVGKTAVAHLMEFAISSMWSGYSFSLTWVKNAVGQEAGLLYHVLSLGTFERVAPEWMREDLTFSLSMCAVFFQRVSQITRLHS